MVDNCIVCDRHKRQLSSQRLSSWRRLFSFPCAAFLVPMLRVGTEGLSLCDKISMARTRYKIFENEAPHFLTCTIVNWLPVFARKTSANIVLDSLRFLQREDRLILFGYVIMENHIHLIAQANHLSVEVGAFKSYAARKIIDYFETVHDPILRELSLSKLDHKIDRDYQLWQEGSHPQEIQNDEMLRQKLTYMHENPVRRGYVDDPVDWRYSSARNYAGKAGLVEVFVDWF